MSAATAYRNTPRLGSENEAILTSIDVPLKDGTKLYVGTVAAIDSTGYGVDPTAVTGLICVGRVHPNQNAAAFYDNTSAVVGHANGFVTAKIDQGVFRFANGTSGDLIAQANVGGLCYLIDDQTVGLTDGGATPRSVAGVIVAVDASGVSVSMVFQVTAAMLAAGAVGGVSGIEQIIASGALAPGVTDSILAVSGTMAFTLAAGTRVGQLKRVYCKSAASTPSGVLTVTSMSDSHTTVTFSAAGQGVLLRWDGAHWNPVQLTGAAIA